jgi:hypothetical protein
VLSSAPVLALLRQEFVNCWVLAKDLEAIAARDGSSDIATLCKRIRDNYGYPVDSVLVAADLRVVGHVNVNDVAVDPVRYIAFLRQGLAAADRTLPAVASAVMPETTAVTGRPRELKLTPAQPGTSLLDVVRCRGFGQPSFVYHAIDATAFAEGGVLEIEVRVGSGTIAATFELCAEVVLPGDESKAGERHFVQPVQSRSVAREGSDKLVHTFKKGDRLGLTVKPAPGSTEGDLNAFLATVTVRRP